MIFIIFLIVTIALMKKYHSQAKFVRCYIINFFDQLFWGGL